MSLQVNSECITICKHCGNRSSHIILLIVPTPDEVYMYGENVPPEKITYNKYIIKCKTCNEITIANDWNYAVTEDYELLEDITGLYVSYPTERKLYSTVPENIKSSYYEAKKVEKISTVAFAIMIRRALEFICEDQSAKGRDLYQNVKDLASRNLIPDKLAEMADSIRVLGNIGAHDTKISLSKEECIVLDEFYLALIEYIYEAPEKIKNLKQSLSKKK